MRSPARRMKGLSAKTESIDTRTIQGHSSRWRLSIEFGSNSEQQAGSWVLDLGGAQGRQFQPASEQQQQVVEGAHSDLYSYNAVKPGFASLVGQGSLARTREGAVRGSARGPDLVILGIGPLDSESLS